MSTPLGHMLTGASAAVTVASPGNLRRATLVGAIAGAAADLDFVPGLLIGDPARFHHGPSHSLAFSLIVAGLAALIASRHRWRWALAAGAAYTTHLLLDLLTFDPSTPVGIPLFWPVDDSFMISPLTLLPRVVHSGDNVVNLHNFGVGLLEAALFGSLYWLVVRSFRDKLPPPGS